MVTMLVMEWDPGKWTMRYSSAGHEHILVWRRGKVEAIPSGGVILGMEADISEFLEAKDLALNPGDKFVLYTDGALDARNGTGEAFGLERLIGSVEAHGGKPPEELLKELKADLETFMAGQDPYDDVTLVAGEALSVSGD
jgi:sigma-B regulation protein RsbU (phosphoserine phosphatase)